MNHRNLAAAALLCAAFSDAHAAVVSCDDLRRARLMKEDVTVIDVRSPVDYALGRVQGARNVPAAQVEGANLPRDGRLVFYCSDISCPLSRNAAEALEKAGYANVSYLQGGFAEWAGRGYPVEKGDRRPPKPRVRHTTLEKAKKRIAKGDVLILDVRPAKEFAAGRIPGAKNVPLEELDAAAAWLSKDREALVYDRVSKRSRKAVEKLQEAGFKATELAGGLGAWVKRKGALEVK